MEILDKPQSQVAAYQPFYAQLAELEQKNETLVFDYEAKAGNKEARSHVHSLRKTKSALESVRKEAKADYLRLGRLVDSEASAIETRIEAMIEVHQVKLDEIEQRETDRRNRMQAKLDELKLVHHDSTVTDYKFHLATLEAVVIDSKWEEFETEALHARAASIIKHRELLAALEKHLAEQEELTKLRQQAAAQAQKERDEAIAKAAVDRAQAEAVAKAKQEAEKAQRAIEAAQAKAKTEKEAAARRELELKLAAETAERRRVEAEQAAKQAAIDAQVRAEQDKARAIKAEQDRVAAVAKAEADALAKREANKAHLIKFNNEAMTAFVDAGLSSEIAKHVVKLIAQGKVPHVTINY